MLPVVVIDVPQDLAAPAAVIVVDRCVQALGANRCRLAAEVEQPSPSAQPLYYATLRPSAPAPAKIVIELRSSSASGKLLATRSLEFSERDAAESRWASVGLVVAGLAAAEDVRRATAPERASAPASTPARSKPSSRKTWASWGVDLGALAGPGFDGGPYRVGGFVRAWHALPPAPQVLLAGSVRYAVRQGEPTGRWFSLGAGVGARGGGRDSLLNAGVMGELVAERMQAASRRAEDGATDRAAALRFGGRISVDLSLWMTSFARLVVGAEATVLTPPVRVEVANAVVERESPARIAMTAGLRFVP